MRGISPYSQQDTYFFRYLRPNTLPCIQNYFVTFDFCFNSACASYSDFSQLTPPSSPVFTRSQPKYVHVTVHLCTLTNSRSIGRDTKYELGTWNYVALHYKLAAKRAKLTIFLVEEYRSLDVYNSKTGAHLHYFLDHLSTPAV